MFGPSDCKWNSDSDGLTFTKYNVDDGKITLDPEDDAAHVNMGDEWKMPTQEQVTELFKETTQELYAKLTPDSEPVKVADGTYSGSGDFVSWDYNNYGHSNEEVAGKLAYMKLLSKSNGNFLVVPSSVDALDGYVGTVGRGGRFWLSSFHSLRVNSAWYGYFFDNNYGVGDNDYRYVGLGVRGVVGQ